jgi:hypothetical protein
MSAGRYSFTIEQGSTLNLELQYKDANGNPIDLTGYGGKMQIRQAVTSPTAYITLSSSLEADGTGLNFSGSNSQTSPSSGSIGLFISAESSSMLNFSTGVYDLEITSGSFVTRILEGQVKLSLNVTR